MDVEDTQTRFLPEKTTCTHLFCESRLRPVEYRASPDGPIPWQPCSLSLRLLTIMAISYRQGCHGRCLQVRRDFQLPNVLSQPVHVGRALDCRELLSYADRMKSLVNECRKAFQQTWWNIDRGVSTKFLSNLSVPWALNGCSHEGALPRPLDHVNILHLDF